MPLKTVAFYLCFVVILGLAALHIANGIQRALIHTADRAAALQ